MSNCVQKNIDNSEFHENSSILIDSNGKTQEESLVGLSEVDVRIRRAEKLKKGVLASQKIVQKLLSQVLESLNGLIARLVELLGQALERLGSVEKSPWSKVASLLCLVVDKFSHFLSEFVEKLFATIAELLNKLVDVVLFALQNHSDSFKKLLNSVHAMTQRYLQRVLWVVKDGLGNGISAAFVLFRRMSDFVGLDARVYATFIALIQKIIQNPVQLLHYSWQSLRIGWRQFYKNIWQNIPIILQNLANIWLDCMHLQLPADFSPLPVLVFALELLGIPANEILRALGLDRATLASLKTHKQHDGLGLILGRFVSNVETCDIRLILRYFNQNFVEITSYLLSSLSKFSIKRILMRDVLRRSSVSTPFSGFATAAKGLVALFTFVDGSLRSIREASLSLVLGLEWCVFGKCGQGANGVEACLCQGFPLLIDTGLRMLGIHVGARLQKRIFLLRELCFSILGRYFSPFVKLFFKLRMSLDKIDRRFAKFRLGRRISRSVYASRSQAWGRRLDENLVNFQNKELLTFYRRLEGDSQKLWAQSIHVADILCFVRAIPSLFKGSKRGALGLERVHNKYELEKLKKFNEYQDKRNVSIYIRGKDAETMRFDLWSEKYDTLYLINADKKRAGDENGSLEETRDSKAPASSTEMTLLDASYVKIYHLLKGYFE